MVIADGDIVVMVGIEPAAETGDDESGIATVAVGLIVGSGNVGTGISLSPPLPISTESNGIPVRETLLGDEDDIAAEDDAALLPLVLHVPELVALPGNGVPVPTPIPPPS